MVKKLNWVEVAHETAWLPRDSQGEVVYANKLWIFGGWFNSFEAPPRDVWSSPDGKNWHLVQSQAPWIHSDLPMSVVFKDKMWILGGTENYYFGDDASLKNDVWCSSDGSHWERVTERAGRSPRAFHQAVVHDGRMWVMGGWAAAPDNYGDVWYSRDGFDWRQLESDVI